VCSSLSRLSFSFAGLSRHCIVHSNIPTSVGNFPNFFLGNWIAPYNKINLYGPIHWDGRTAGPSSGVACTWPTARGLHTLWYQWYADHRSTKLSHPGSHAPLPLSKLFRRTRPRTEART
jgi:hypothetical protein